MGLDKGLIAGVALLGAFAFFMLLCTLRNCCTRRQRGRRQLQEQQQQQDERNEVSEPLISEDYSVGQTLKRQPSTKLRPDANLSGSRPKSDIQEEKTDVISKGNRLMLEVISGPSSGVRVSQEPSALALTMGRISQNDLVLNDPEVSGKHAFIKWNSEKWVWELVDMGSLNGTLLNEQSIQPQQNQNGNARLRGEPMELANGDIVTLGSTSQVLVQISCDGGRAPSLDTMMPFSVGVATDPMTMWRSGKRSPMEDVCLWEWPLRGFQQFGVFCLFDGHGGAAAAEAASKIMPQKLSDILKSDSRQMGVLENCDATDVLRDAFRETEETLHFEFEGCTATVLLLWCDANKTFYAQCANVGDSACIFSVGGTITQLTEDHRLTSLTEKSRFLEMGKQLNPGETRICGMNIARALGDKFLKEQDERFSAEPFISEVLRFTRESEALAVIASDGLWDVLSPKRAMQLSLQGREEYHMNEGKGNKQVAKRLATMLLGEARNLRTKDNTSVIVLDFVQLAKASFNTI